MSYRQIMVVAFAVVSALAPTRLPAQDAASPALTLEEALAEARRHNPELRKAVHGLERAAAAERSGWGALLPEIRAEGSISDFSSRTQTALNEFGQPVALEEPASFSGASGFGRLNASIVLFDGLRGVRELRAARAGSRAADARHEADALRIEAEVRRRFYDALGAERLVEVEERLLEAAERRLDAMQAMVVAGRATRQDVLGMEADLAGQRMALEAARAGAYSARLLLREVTGVSEPADFAVAGEFPELLDPTPLAEQDVVERALRRNPRVWAAEQMEVRAGHAAGAAGALRWPTVRLGTRMDREVSLAERSQITDFPWNRGFVVGITASIPIFTGFSLSETIVRARTERADAAEDLRAARLAVEREARVALAEAVSAYRSVQFAERAAELALHRLEMGQEGFQVGIIGFTELQQLIDRAALAERTAVRARMGYARAMATLQEVAGGEIPLPRSSNERED